MRLPLSFRKALALPVRRLRLRIHTGPNRGMRWSVAAAGRAMAAGGFEPERFQAFAAMLRPDDVLWDVGAHQGYSVLVAAGRISGRAGHIYAFEPSGYNLWYLRKHLAWNGVGNAEVIPVALSDFCGGASFGGAGSSACFALDCGRERVNVSTIDCMVSEGLRPPTVLKVDAEGAETQVLGGARDLLARAAATGTLPLLLLSVHSSLNYQGCLQIMRSFGYRVVASRNLEKHRQKEGNWMGDPDLLAIPPGRDLSEALRTPWFAAGLTLDPG